MIFKLALLATLALATLVTYRGIQRVVRVLQNLKNFSAQSLFCLSVKAIHYVSWSKDGLYHLCLGQCLVLLWIRFKLRYGSVSWDN